MIRISRQARIEHMHNLMKFVSNCAIRFGFSQKRIMEIELATEEALANIISYAYEDNAGDVEITCRQDNDRRFIIEIIDTGRPFDVLSREDPDITCDIEDRETGGLGIFLMKKFMDDVKYRREKDKNILTFIVWQD